MSYWVQAGEIGAVRRRLKWGLGRGKKHSVGGKPNHWGRKAFETYNSGWGNDVFKKRTSLVSVYFPCLPVENSKEEEGAAKQYSTNAN